MEASAEWPTIEEMVDAVSGLTPVRLDLPPPPPPQSQANGAAVAAPPPPPAQDGGAQSQSDSSQTSGQFGGQPGGQTPGAPSDPTRVVVEQGQDKFVLVLKVLNNATGDVLAEIPNQTPQQAAENPNYHAGSLLNQTV